MKMLRIFAALVAVCWPAMAAEQFSFVLPTSPVAGANDLGSLTANYYNPAMRALAGSHNGPTAPANGPGGAPLLGQPWFDTSASPSINLRYWDGASWATLATLDASTHAWIIASASTIRSVTGTSDTLLDGDRGKLVDVANAGSVAQILPQAGTGGVFSAGWYATVRNSGAGTITITPTTSLIDGVTTLALRSGQTLTIRSDGTNYKTTLLHQPANANLWGLSGLSTAADKCVYWTGAGLPALLDCKSWFRAVMAAADVAAGRAALGLTIGSDVQAYNANLAAWSGLTGAAGKVGYFTGLGALAMFDSTSFGRSISNVADAAALRTLAGLNNVANVDTTTQANVSFTGLSAAAAAADADTLPVNQGAGNLKQTFAAIKTWIKAWIVKGDVGLGNVDNTSDATKWAATKTLTNTTYDTSGTGNSFSINGVAATANTGTGAVARAVSPALTGAPTAPTASPSDNSTKIATTAYVDAQVSGSVAGVSSIDSATGALTISGLLARSSQDLRVVAASKSNQQTGSSSTVAVTPLHQQDHDSAAKAWAVFTGATPPVVLASYNVTSITRNSLGSFTLNFTTAFASTSFVCNVTGDLGGAIIIGIAGTRATGSFQSVFANTGTAIDPSVGHVICYGRQ